MSTKNRRTVDIASILERIGKLYKIEKDYEIAELIGLESKNFSAKKKRGTLLQDVTSWCIENNLDCNYILQGNKSHSYSYDILKDLHQWLDSKSDKRKNNEIWFLIESEKNFKDFLLWKEKKERGDYIAVDKKIA